MKNILTIDFNEDEGTYNIQVPQGSSVNETLFSVSVLIRCLIRDGFVKDVNEATETITRYCTDEQFAEITKGEENDIEIGAVDTNEQ